MAYKLILLLSLSTIAAGFIGDARVARRTTNVDFSDNPAAAFRYANFPSLVGRQIHARQEDCGCQENGKLHRSSLQRCSPQYWNTLS